MPDVQVTKNFKRSEFECPHCHENKIQGALIQLVQKIRDKAGEPVHIESGYRCPEHNKEVGGVANSSHTLGLAADIYIGSNGNYWPQTKIAALIKDMYKKGELPELKYSYLINGKNKNTVHVDIDKSKKRWRVLAY